MVRSLRDQISAQRVTKRYEKMEGLLRPLSAPLIRRDGTNFGLSERALIQQKAGADLIKLIAKIIGTS